MSAESLSPGVPPDFEEFLVSQRSWLERLARALAVQSGTDHHALFSATVAVLHRRWPTIAADVETRRSFARRVMARCVGAERRRPHARAEEPSDDLCAILERRLPDQWADDPEFEVVSNERRLEIYRAIGRLDEPEREIMARVAIGCTWPEIGEDLDLSPKDVRNGVLRARRALRTLREGGSDDR